MKAPGCSHPEQRHTRPRGRRSARYRSPHLLSVPVTCARGSLSLPRAARNLRMREVQRPGTGGRHKTSQRAFGEDFGFNGTTAVRVAMAISFHVATQHTAGT